MIGKEEFWDDVKNELSKTMQTISYEIWIEKLEPVCFVDSTFVLAANTAMAKKTIDRSYLDQIREVVNSLDSFVTDVEIIVKDQEGEYLEKQSVSLPDKGLIVDEKYSHKNKGEKASPFLEKYTFETFVQGKSNEYALAAAKTVAENPGGKYNPLFIYSGVGLGKTHLLHAIGNYLRKKSPKTKVVYANCETMINELISVIRGGNNEDSNRFREKYRNIDVLLIDDIQFIIGKESSQLEFFNTFETLFQLNKQIVISSDKPPRDMPELDDRYRTRFSSGLLVDIQPPDYETSMAILNNFKEKESIQVDEEVLRFIATNIRSSVRELEGAFKKVQYFSTLSHQKITLELAENALKDMIKPDSAREITVEYIIDIVTDHFQLSSDAIVSKKRQKTIAYPRQICMYLCKELTDLSTTEIGEKIGGRDHSTVIHGCAKIEELINTDPTVKKMIDILIKKINP